MSYDSVIAGDSPTYWWKLGESSGTSATDSADSNGGTYQGTVTLGRTGLVGSSATAALLDGSTGWITTTVSATAPSAFSIEVWFKTTATQLGVLVQYNGSQTAANGATEDRVLFVDSTGKVNWSANGGQVAIVTTAAYNDGNWHHAVVTLASGPSSTLYVDGVQIGTSAQAPFSYTGWWRVGEGGGATSGFFKGTLGHAAIYSSVLTSGQVSAHYTAGISPPPPPQPPRVFFERPRLQVLAGDRDVTERCDTITFSATDTGGYEIATFGLPSTDRPRKGAPITVRAGLEVAWAGRTAEISDHSQHNRATKTTGYEGLVAVLRDNPISMIYVDRDLTKWGAPSNQRQIGLLGANFALASSTPAADTATGFPSVVQEIDDSWTSPYLPTSEAWYDAGTLNLIAMVYYNALASGPALATTDQIDVCADDVTTGAQTSANLYSTIGNAGYFTPAQALRYALLQKIVTATPGGQVGARYLTSWRNVAVYGNHGLTLRGSDPGGLYPSDVARHALAHCAGIVPGVIVDSTGYIAPHVVYGTPTGVDQIIDDMAKLMGWPWGVWEPATAFGSQPRLDFRPPPSDATAVVTKAECDQIDITSRLGDLYNACEVTYTDPAGVVGVAVANLANPALIESGVAARTLSLNMGAGNAADAQAFGAIALALSQVSARAAGQATLPVSVRLPYGGSKPAVLLRPGIDRLRIVDLQDGGPMFDLANVRRDVFRISRVETTVNRDGSLSTRAEIDSGTNLLETLQARLALAAGVVGQGASGG